MDLCLTRKLIHVNTGPKRKSRLGSEISRLEFYQSSKPDFISKDDCPNHLHSVFKEKCLVKQVTIFEMVFFTMPYFLLKLFFHIFVQGCFCPNLHIQRHTSTLSNCQVRCKSIPPSTRLRSLNSHLLALSYCYPSTFRRNFILKKFLWSSRKNWKHLWAFKAEKKKRDLCTFSGRFSLGGPS